MAAPGGKGEAWLRNPSAAAKSAGLAFENHRWCCPEHGAEFAMQKLEKKREKQAQAKAKKERAEWRKRKAAVKPLRHWEDMTQRVVNDYIRERDHDLPFISCGTFDTVQWEAGHDRSRGKASHLRYNEDNIHKQMLWCRLPTTSALAHFQPPLC